MDNIKVGSKVRYFKKVVETRTEIPLGSVGIVCDIEDTEFDSTGFRAYTLCCIHHYYVIILTLARLEYLGEV